jgi:hypothetical protein
MFPRYLIALITFACSSQIVYSQDDVMGGSENGSQLNVLYRRDKSAKIYATTRGYGLLYRQGKHVNAKTRSYFEIDLQTLRHSKEKKSVGDAETKKRFVYGKINSVLLLRGAVGLQNVIFSKADVKAVEVRYSYSLGPVLAFAKPYYLQVYRQNSNKPEIMKFDSEAFTPGSNVAGRGDFDEGIDEMNLYAGVCGKFNLSFEYAPYTNLIRAIETGLSLDYFPRALPIMARNPAENFVITFHVGFVFGRKWF